MLENYRLGKLGTDRAGLALRLNHLLKVQIRKVCSTAAIDPIFQIVTTAMEAEKELEEEEGEEDEDEDDEDFEDASMRKM